MKYNFSKKVEGSFDDTIKNSGRIKKREALKLYQKLI